MASDGLGGLVCTLSDDHQTGAARASDPDEALADLLGALDNAAIKGSGECFWLREAGQYRWVIRRHDKTTARLGVRAVEFRHDDRLGERVLEGRRMGAPRRGAPDCYRRASEAGRRIGLTR